MQDIEISLDDMLISFHMEIDKCLSMFYDAITLYDSSLDSDYDFKKEMRNMVIDSNFLSVCRLWENFIEQIFIKFMLGEKSSNADAIQVFVSPNDTEHAYKMIKNTNSYPDWSDISKINVYAEIFFFDKGPFKILDTMKTELLSIKKVRNQIAHNSKKSNKEFHEFVRNIGIVPNLISTSEFLLRSVKNTQEKYFEKYLNYLKDSATILVEFKKNI